MIFSEPRRAIHSPPRNPSFGRHSARRMKTIIHFTALALLFTLTTGHCFGMWDVEEVSRERAKELGIEIRSQPAGPGNLLVELEFPTKGKFEKFGEGRSSSDPSRVDLRIGTKDKLLLTTTLREDRSKQGRIIVSFTADASQLDQISLWVLVAEGAGGQAYGLPVKDLVGSKKNG
ncbi:MAG: hypothetical protein K1X78_23685 [Verrucomicrobiaceae bacterium]|nr:hypothetical protein [Verrucomicrobiaceae bacterium]